MSVENPRWESRKDGQAYEIGLDITFKPFEKASKPYWPKRGAETFIIPESYSYTLLLRKKVSLLKIEGYIDIINEDPKNQFTPVAENYPLDQPLGLAYFRMIYGGKDDIEYTQYPYILRFAFLLNTPAEYSKLLNSFIDVKLGEEEYLLAWNISRPAVKRRMLKLESGEKTLVTQKNLFKLQEGDVEDIDIEDKKFGRVTFVWLPDELKALRTISLTFRQFDDGNDHSEPSTPVIPDMEKVPYLV